MVVFGVIDGLKNLDTISSIHVNVRVRLQPSGLSNCLV